MKNSSLLSITLVSLLMLGCAATPKPALPDDQYSVSAQQWGTLYQCGINGNISADTASLGKVYFESNMDGYSYDRERWLSEVQVLNAKQFMPTKQQCNALAIEIASTKRQIEQHNQAVNADQQAIQDITNSTRPRNTYCNKIGTQVFCNTY